MKKKKILWLTLIIFFAIFLLFFIYCSYFLKLPDELLLNSTENSKRVFDRNGELIYIFSKNKKQHYVKYEKLPKNFINAVISAEDKNFFSHNGIDIFAVFRSTFLNLKNRKIVSGASTIDMQTVKILEHQNQKRDMKNKIKEMMLALRMSKKISKEKVFEKYINNCFYGNKNYGAEAASRDYFEKSVSKLDLTQSAFLAGIIKNPSKFNPKLHFLETKKRQEKILDLMYKNGFISKDNLISAKKEKIKIKTKKDKNITMHFLQNLKPQESKEIFTTMDLELQKEGKKIIKKNLENLKTKGAHNSAMIVIKNDTGEVLVYIGSADFYNEEIDGQVDILKSYRQLGSSVKPFIYAMAIKEGMDGSSVLHDEEKKFITGFGTNYVPQNFDNKFHGFIRLRDALAGSLNMPTVIIIDFLGYKKVFNFFENMDFIFLEGPQNYQYSIALGSAEMRLFDLAQAYTVFPNGGKMSKIKFLKNEKTFQRKIFDETIAFQIANILSDNDAKFSQFGLFAKKAFFRNQAFKTGTTRNFKDSVCIGFNDEITVAVWVGNANGDAMHEVTGFKGAFLIFKDFMNFYSEKFNQDNYDVLTNENIEKKIKKEKICIVPYQNPCKGYRDEWVWKNKKNDNEIIFETKNKIKFPLNGDVFLIDKNIDKKSQKIIFKANGDDENFVWFLNDEKIGEGKNYLWLIEKGKYSLKLEKGDEVFFEVRE